MDANGTPVLLCASVVQDRRQGVHTYVQVLRVKLMKLTLAVTLLTAVKFSNIRVFSVDHLYCCITQMHLVKIFTVITQMHLVKTRIY
jgi:hypothetical protein